METSIDTSNTCRSCNNEFTGKYCNACGEKVYDEHDRSVVYIVEEAFHFLTHFEGNLFGTIKTMFRKPGQVTLDYCNGIRKKYYKPITLFCVLIFIYLLFPSIFPRGLDMELKYHLGQYPYREYANHMVQQKMLQKHLSYEQLSEAYAHTSHSVSKVLLFILLPISALFLVLLYPGKKLFFDNFMLSTEINAVFLSAFFILLPFVLQIVLIPAVVVYQSVSGHLIGSNSFLNSELPMVVSSTLLFIAFTTVCFKRFYGSGTAVSIAKAIVFVALHYVLVFFFYKFLLFAVTMWMV